MQPCFHNRKIVITGGSSGIGKACAVLLVKAGAHVCILGRNRDKLESAVREIKNTADPSCVVISRPVDVSDRTSLFNSAGEIVESLGGIDLLINSAGITHPGYLHAIPDGVWDSMIAVDYMGTVNSVRAFLPFFIERKQGHIVNISSTLGYMGVFGYAAYGAAKFAVTGFSECIRQDLLPYNVGVSVVYPPDTDTPQWHEENKIKPPETAALAGTIKVMKAEKVASIILAGVEKKKFRIIPGAMNRFVYFINRHFPAIVWMIVSADLTKFWKKQGK